MHTDFDRAAEEFLQQIGSESYQNGAGLKDSLEIVPIFEKYGWIFERSIVEESLARHDAEGKHIAAFTADGYLESSVKELSEKITNEVTGTTVEWQGEDVPYRRVSVLIANEPDASRRHELERRLEQKTETTNPARIERLQKLHSLSIDLGFDSYASMYDRLKNLSLEWLLCRTEELLNQTEEIYASELHYYLDTLGLSIEEATAADLTHLFRAPQFDALFPQDKLIPSLKATLSGMGISLESQKNIKLDTEPRPLKSPRAFCVPVRVPDEVYLVISPKGGQDDYRAIMHESGHAEHLGSISPDLPFAFKRLGDGAISESYAFLMDNLLKNHHWLAQVLGERGVDDYLRLARFHKLWIIRRYAAKLHYEKLLHTASDVEAMRGQYVEKLGHAIKVKISPANFLSDVDDGLYAGNYLRAWMFEVMLRKHFEDTFGTMWFRTPQAGEMLVGMWTQGQRYNLDELSQQLCYERLDCRPLACELTR